MEKRRRILDSIRATACWCVSDPLGLTHAPNRTLCPRDAREAVWNAATGLTTSDWGWSAASTLSAVRLVVKTGPELPGPDDGVPVPPAAISEASAERITARPKRRTRETNLVRSRKAYLPMAGRSRPHRIGLAVT